MRPRFAASVGAIFFAALPIAATLGARALPVAQAIAALWGTPWRTLPRLAHTNRLWLLPLLAALGWAMASAFWSPTPDAPMRATKLALVIGLALLFAAGAGHNAAARALTRRSVVLSVLALVGLSCLEASAGMPLNRLVQPDAIDMIALQRNPGRGVCILTLLIYPALVGLWRSQLPWRRLGSFAVLAIVIWLSLQFDLDANGVALAGASTAFLLALALPRAALAISGAAWAGWLLAAPWASGHVAAFSAGLPLSWRMREEIWAFASARIMERPIWGWGFEASRSFTDQQQHLDGVIFANIPLHTHSGSMQIWLEFGAIGALLVALAVLLAARCAMRALGNDRLACAGAAAAASAAMIHFNVSYGAWQEWWLAALASTAVAAASLRTPVEA